MKSSTFTPKCALRAGRAKVSALARRRARNAASEHLFLQDFEEQRKMCGITGSVGARPGVRTVVDTLRRLEDRGYDSAGVAEGQEQEAVKAAGKRSALEAERARGCEIDQPRSLAKSVTVE